jgi:hypothetical protein
MRQVSRGFWIAAATALTLIGAAPAQAANWFEKNIWMHGPRYDARLPACDDAFVLATIQSRFAQKEFQYWSSSLQLLSFDKIRETAFRPWAENTIPRRFCSGYTMVQDGVRRPIHYWIGEDTGPIGHHWGVEWCVVGLDRNWAYNPGCKMTMP